MPFLSNWLTASGAMSARRLALIEVESPATRLKTTSLQSLGSPAKLGCIEARTAKAMITDFIFFSVVVLNTVVLNTLQGPDSFAQARGLYAQIHQLSIRAYG
jgi:hypothetical protein